MKFEFGKNMFLCGGEIVLTSEESPIDGDKVFVPDYPTSVWEFRSTPCPMPFWGNANACKKILHTLNITTIELK